MAQQVKGFAIQALEPEFNPWEICKQRRGNTCSLTSTRVQTHIHHTRIPKTKDFLKYMYINKRQVRG